MDRSLKHTGNVIDGLFFLEQRIMNNPTAKDIDKYIGWRDVWHKEVLKNE